MIDPIDDTEEHDIDHEIDRSRPSFGDWRDEAAAAAEFDRRIAASGMFRSYAEVRGFYLAHRPNREQKDARIDRILIPTPAMILHGWRRCIGVEIKRSGEKIGRPLAQAIDYTYCNWNLADNAKERRLMAENRGHKSEVPDMWMMVENVFLWPFQKQHRAVESVMLQNTVGVIYDSPYTPLIFQLEKMVIRIERDGQVRVQAPTCGRKVGSR